MITPELKREGMARDFIRHVQQMRKDAGLEITDRIRIADHTEDRELDQAIQEWREYICAETLAEGIERGEALTVTSAMTEPDSPAKTVAIEGAKVVIHIRRVAE